MASIDWYSPSQGQTFIVKVGKSTRFTINAEGSDGSGYYWRIKITASDSRIKFANNTQLTYSDSAFNKEPLTQSIPVTGVSTGSSVITLQMQYSYDGEEWCDSDVSARTINYTVQTDSTTYDLRDGTPDPSVLKTGDILICPYSGAIKYCILPKGTYKLEAWGARGGDRSSYTSNKYGKGGYCTGWLDVSQQTTYYCVAGGAGAQNAAGYNGGGSPGGSSGCGGGGATHISTVSSLLSDRSGDYTNTVIMVAAGGGGTSHSSCTYGNNGDGGGLTGISGASYSSSYTVATGGTQSGGGTGGEGHNTTGYSGSFGKGGNGNSGSNFAGAGGGGGLYGGGGGGGSNSIFYNRNAGGAGGSSYYNTSFLTEYSTIAGNASMPSPSGDTETGHDDNGYIKITIIEIEVSIPLLVNIAGTYKQVINAYVNVNGAWKDVTDIKTNVGGTWK